MTERSSWVERNYLPNPFKLPKLESAVENRNEAFIAELAAQLPPDPSQLDPEDDGPFAFRFVHYMTGDRAMRLLAEQFTEIEAFGRIYFAILENAQDVGSGTYFYLAYYPSETLALQSVPNQRQLREQYEERDLGDEFATHFELPSSANTDTRQFFMEAHQLRGKALRMLREAEANVSNFERALDPNGETIVIPPGYRFTLTHQTGTRPGILANGEPIQYHPFPPEECRDEGGRVVLEMANVEVREMTTIVIPAGVEAGWLAVDFLSDDDF